MWSVQLPWNKVPCPQCFWLGKKTSANKCVLYFSPPRDPQYSKKQSCFWRNKCQKSVLKMYQVLYTVIGLFTHISHIWSFSLSAKELKQTKLYIYNFVCFSSFADREKLHMWLIWVNNPITVYNTWYIFKTDFWHLFLQKQDCFLEYWGSLGGEKYRTHLFADVFFPNQKHWGHGTLFQGSCTLHIQTWLLIANGWWLFLGKQWEIPYSWGISCSSPEVPCCVLAAYTPM